MIAWTKANAAVLPGLPTLAVSVLDDEGRERYRSGRSLLARYDGEARFPFLFFDIDLIESLSPFRPQIRYWTVRTGYDPAGIETIVRHETRPHRWVWLLVAFVALAGFVLTARATAREILDVMLPRLSGFTVCRSLKERGVATPILMLTARAQESEKVLGLELGADDYVTKPFSIHELLARVRAMVRRSSSSSWLVDRYRFGDVDLNFGRQQARKGRRRVPLSALEFEVLRYLIGRRGQVVPRDQLLNDVWRYQAFRTTRAVDNLMARLRQKLEPRPHEPRHILTVHGIGYKFVD